MGTFATLVQQGRAATGLSHQRIAELVGRAPSTVRGWEGGRSEPTDPEVVMALAAVLDLPEGELLESVGLSRPSGSLGGSFADLAPTDLDHDEVVEPHRVESADSASADEDIEAGVDEEVGSRDSGFDRAATRHDAATSGAIPEPEDPETVQQTPESSDQQRDPAVMSRSAPRVVRAETHRTAIPPQPLLVPPVQRSYLEDQRQMTTYRVRALLTFAILVVLFLLVEWGLHGAGHSLKDALSGLSP